MSNLSSIFSPKIISAIIGASIVLISNLITSIINYYKSKNKLKHQEKLENKERQIEMKKEVFFPAIEYLSKIRTYILSFPTINEENNNFESEIKKIDGVLNRINLVASNETIEAVEQVSMEMNKYTVPLITQKAECKIIKEKLDEKKSQIDKWSNKQRTIINEKTYLLEKRIANEDEMERLNENEEEVKNVLREISKDKNKLEKEFNQKYKKLVNNCIEAAVDISKYSIDAIAAMRKELELPFDKDSYKNMVEESTEQAESELKKLISTLDKQYN